ncbi:MAG: hypothetical protein WCD76_07875, partial [Pyrinomonadaceae bacterium]
PAPAMRPAVAPTPADIKIRTKTTIEGNSYERTEYIKGARERTESAMGGGFSSTSILQCDLKRMVMVSDRSRMYMVQSTFGDDSTNNESPSTNEPQSSGVQPRTGGIITVTRNFTDTGERKDFFGYKARHLKTSMTMESSADACDKTAFRQETDGWYIDLNYGIDCGERMRPTMPGGRQSRPRCQDRMVFKSNGAGRLGHLVEGTTTFYDERGDSHTTTQEVIELSRASLDPALFDVPAGYTEAKSYQEFAGIKTGGFPMPDMDEEAGDNGHAGGATTAATNSGGTQTVRVKQPGAIRIGVAAINNATDHPVSIDALRARLAGAISDAGVEAVALSATSPNAVAVEAGEKDCDFILYTDITAMKQSKAGKIGGMFGRATGVGAMGADKTDSKIDFRLLPLAGATPLLQSSTTAKEEGDEASAGAALDREAQAVVAAVRKRK